jgi:geranylgeranyl pyrophosphate synthase
MRQLEQMSQIVGEPIPSAAMLHQLIDLKYGNGVDDWLVETLLTPVLDIMGRPSKRFRARLVLSGCLLTSKRSELSAAERKLCEGFGDLVELLHAGSLVVDDIEDQSQVRRGQPTLHLKYGTPLALNAGNWLYFWPLMKVGAMRLPLETELSVHRHCHQVMVKLHCGQALDNGVTIDTLPQETVPGVCLSSMELKTGALIALALSLGAAAAESPIEPSPALSEFGQGFGVALQMFDDLGNLQGNKEPEKRYEDLIDRRPCWVWAYAAETFSEENYRAFVEAVRLLPDDESLLTLLDEQNFHSKARQAALKYFETVFQNLENSLGSERQNKAEALGPLRLLGQQVSNSYC